MKRYYEWISVKDELPEYEEVVIVCNEKDTSDVWFTYRSDKPYVCVDNNGFTKTFEDDVTHWMRIKLLNDK